jgi:hypothetical protein
MPQIPARRFNRAGKYQAPITNDQNKFRILNLGNWNLFAICDLLFGIFCYYRIRATSISVLSK